MSLKVQISTPRAFNSLGFFTQALTEFGNLSNFSKIKEYNYSLHVSLCKQVTFALNFLEI